ncbi:GvpL/GvpF family gas vesicle protein [Nostoc sp. FACHB-110]|nr:GvpL/GvpF family gas vesicle protein [Nostoc sp. FACHB-110]
MRSPNLYTYAFCKNLNFPVSLPKGNLAPLVIIKGNQISAVVELDISLESSQNNDEQIIKMVLNHDRVICELSHQMTVLPLRFGTYFHSQAALLNHIETHTPEYEQKLNKIQGKHEYTLKLIPQKIAEMAMPVAASGRDYFMAKKQHYEYQKSFINAQNEEKTHLINLITVALPSDVIIQQHTEEVRLHILVDDHEQALLKQQVVNWQAQCPHWQFILGEPLPPYHFV